MEERVRFRPFTGDMDRKIAMTNAPLSLVLVQIRWPEHARFLRDFRSLALDFGEQLRDFPLYQEVNEAGIQITPEGVQSVRGETAYQWQTIDGVWTVHLSARFVSLYCLGHTGYRFSELMVRLEHITELLRDVLQVRSTERVGVRYVNRVSEPRALEALNQIFDASALGYANLARNDNVELLNAMTQAMYRAEEVTLHVRSGYLNPGDTVDAAVPALDRKSWVLDLDASDEGRREFDPAAASAEAGRLADAIYDFFKLVLRPGEEARLEG